MSLFVPIAPKGIDTYEATPAEIPHLSWRQFLRSFDFSQGEHVTVLGPTGSGKTTLTRELLRLRDHVVTFATKPHDPVVEAFTAEGYTVIPAWPPPEPREYFRKIVLWPPISRIEQTVSQRQAFVIAIENIYEQGKWAVHWNEARYMIEFLNLRLYAELLWLQARSNYISFIVEAQRPAWLPLSAYDQATHLFVAFDSDERNVKRLVEISPVDPVVMRASLNQLQEHDFLYFNTRTKQAAVTRIPPELVKGQAA